MHVAVVPKQHVASLIDPAGLDEPVLRELLATVQNVAASVSAEHGAAAVVTNVGDYQDSKHLHVHVHSGPRLGE